MTKKMLIRWVILIALVAGLAYAFVQLGEWQLRRLDERRATNAQVVEFSEQDPVPYESVMNRVMTDADEWKPVTVTGTYSGETYQARYRNQGVAGSEPVSVMKASDGREVLVSRGFIPRPQGQPDPAPPAPPSGEVTVVGYVQRNEHGNQNAITPHEFNVRLINSDEIGKSLGRELVDGYIAATSSDPADNELIQPTTLPELTEGSHQSYAWQWFSFAVIAVIGVGVLIRADIKDRKKAQEKAKRRRARLEAARETQSASQQ